MTRMMKTGVALAALLVAAGCTRSMPSFGGDSGPAPLMAAPTPQVSANRLPPPPPPPPPPPAPEETMATAGTDDAEAGTDAAAGADTDSANGSSGTGTDGASTQVAAASAPVSREGLVGAWKVSSGGGNCQIFMALTKWTGGYRAASRGCPGQVADVQAWDVSGSQVVLKDSGGSTVASLSSSGGSRYEGTTTGGQPISLYR